MSDNVPSLSGPHFVVSAEGEIHGEDTPENREIVRRIHACLNACEGLSTEELEKGIVDDMRRVLGQVAPLLEQRDAQQPARPRVVIENRPIVAQPPQNS